MAGQARSKAPRHLALGALAAAAALVVAACGSSGGSTAASSSGGSASDASKRAQDAIAPLIGKSTPFPVTTALGGSVRGKTIGYLEANTPTAASYRPRLQAAADLLGIKLNIVSAGSSAATTAAAANAIAQTKPDAFLDIAIDPVEFQPAVETMKSEGIPMLGVSLVDAPKYGLTPLVGSDYFGQSGKILADSLIAKRGNKTDAVFYNVPELAFTPTQVAAFKKEYKALCSDCNLRMVNIPISALGTTAPNTIVSDLQGHSSTNAVALPISDIMIGLPAALTRAGVQKPTIVSGSPNASTYQYMKSGDITEAFTLDSPVYNYTAIDELARLMLGNKPDPGETSNGGAVYGVLRPQDVTFDLNEGWNPYPDYIDRFKKLWGVS